MAIPKVMGIETEYGITVKNQPDFNPILSSLLLINSYETYRSSRVRWDYEAESPLRDARARATFARSSTALVKGPWATSSPRQAAFSTAASRGRRCNDAGA